MVTLKQGEAFPVFSSKTFDEKTVIIPADFKGKHLVVYFYPKDMTSGCTIEGVDFTKLLPDFRKIGAEVVGVSVDSPESHKTFCAMNKLGITLLTDEGGVLGKKLGILRESGSHERTTFVLDQKGIILEIYESVKPAGHAAHVLEYCKSLNV